MKILNFKKVVLVGDKKFTVYSIGWFAFIVHRTPWTIRNWQNKGILPEPILSLGNNVRWYLADEIVGYARIYRNADVRAGKKIGDTLFKHHAHVYQAELRKLLKGKDEKLLDRIPNDDIIGKALMGKREIRYNEEIENILRAKNETTEKEETYSQQRNSRRKRRPARNR